MKTIDELIKEINGSKEMQEELKNANDLASVDAFLKKHDCGATAKELAEYIKSLKNDGPRGLSDDEVSEVAGGIWMNIGFGWVWVDDTPPIQKQTGTVLPGTGGITIEDE